MKRAGRAPGRAFRPFRRAAAAALPLLFAMVLAANPLPGATSALLGYETVWNVTGHFSVLPTCPGQGSPGFATEGCGLSSGAVFVPSLDRLALAYYYSVGAVPQTQTGTGSYLWTLNASTQEPVANLSLPCAPRDVFYPGSGTTVDVACTGYGPSNLTQDAVIAVDVASDQRVGSVTLPGYFPDQVAGAAFAFDPENDRLYACDAANSTLLGLSVPLGSLESVTALDGGCLSVDFDSVSGSLLVGNQDPGIQVVSPATDAVLRTILPTDNVTAVLVNGPSGWVAVGSVTPQAGVNGEEVGVVTFVSAANYATLSTVTLGSEPNIVTEPVQLLYDARHGEILAICNGADVAVNVTEGRVDGYVLAEGWLTASATFDPGTETIYLQTPNALSSYLGSTELTYSSTQLLTSLLWLPPPLAGLALAGVVGAVAGFAVWARRRAAGMTPSTAAPR